LKKITQHYRH